MVRAGYFSSSLFALWKNNCPALNIMEHFMYFLPSIHTYQRSKHVYQQTNFSSSCRDLNELLKSTAKLFLSSLLLVCINSIMCLMFCYEWLGSDFLTWTEEIAQQTKTFAEVFLCDLKERSNIPHRKENMLPRVVKEDVKLADCPFCPWWDAVSAEEAFVPGVWYRTRWRHRLLVLMRVGSLVLETHSSMLGNTFFCAKSNVLVMTYGMVLVYFF